MNKIKVTKQEAWRLGNLYATELEEKNIAPELITIFLKIKEKHER